MRDSHVLKTKERCFRWRHELIRIGRELRSRKKWGKELACACLIQFYSRLSSIEFKRGIGRLLELLENIWQELANDSEWHEKCVRFVYRA